MAEKWPENVMGPSPLYVGFCGTWGTWRSGKILKNLWAIEGRVTCKV